MIYIRRLPSSLRWKIRLEAELADLTRRHLKDNQWQGNAAQLFIGPSSIFLIRTLRSTTSLSAVNRSLSEVTRTTIVQMRNRKER